MNLLLVALGCAIVFSLVRQLMLNNGRKTSSGMSTSLVPEEFVRDLEEAGYFKYTAPTDIAQLRNSISEIYGATGALVSLWHEETGNPIDYRDYLCDNESLFESGGFCAMLQEMQPTFDKIGFTIKVDSEKEFYDDEKGWNYSITINGREHIVFSNFKGYGWGEAVVKYVQILNEELSRQGIEDRLYPRGGGNDGEIFILSDAQFEVIDKYCKGRRDKPLPLEEWCILNEIAV